MSVYIYDVAHTCQRMSRVQGLDIACLSDCRFSAYLCIFSTKTVSLGVAMCFYACVLCRIECHSPHEDVDSDTEL